ncbi:hypothetical protein ElyMa_003925300, partial [Elysia marginata]
GEVQPWAGGDAGKSDPEVNGSPGANVGFDLHEIHEEDETDNVRDLDRQRQEDEEEEDPRLLPLANSGVGNGKDSTEQRV